MVTELVEVLGVACEPEVAQELQRFELGLSVDKRGRIVVDCALAPVEPRIVNLRKKNFTHLPPLVVKNGILDVSEAPDLQELPSHLEVSVLVAQLCPKLRRIGKHFRITSGTYMTNEMIAIHKTFCNEGSDAEDRLAFWKLMSVNVTTIKSAQRLRRQDFVELGFGDVPHPVRQGWVKKPLNPRQYVKYPGDLAIEGCPSLQALPEDLYVPGHLHLSLVGVAETGALKVLPAHLYVGGDIDASRSSLEVISPGLRVRGFLNVSHTPGLRELSADMRIGKGLYLKGCSNLTVLPEGMKVRGDVNIEGSGIRALPESMRELNGKFYAGPGFESLLDNMHANKMFLKNANIKEIPANLCVTGELMRVTECSELEIMHGGFDRGYAWFEDCQMLKSIEGPFTGSHLEACNCQSLVSLPDTLPLIGLVVPKCPSLERLPLRRPRLDVPMWSFDISDCERITSIPAAALQVGTSPAMCYFSALGKTGLDGGARIFLETYLSKVWKGAYVSVTPCTFEEIKFTNLSHARKFWGQKAQADGMFDDSIDPDTNEGEPLSRGRQSSRDIVTRAFSYLRPLPRSTKAQLLQFLALLRCTREMTMTETQKTFAKRVCEVLEQFIMQRRVQSYIASEITKDSTACDALRIFSNIHMIAKQSSQSDAFVSESARRRLEGVRNAAKEFRENQGLSESCTYTTQVAFELALADQLDLPVSRILMHIPYFMKPTPEDLEKCRQAVLYDPTEL